LQLKVREY
jgi:hypothetical protein